MLEQVTKCHPPETCFNNCTSQQSPWCDWYCTWAVHVPQPDRAAVPQGLTGCNIGHHSDAWVPSWPLESGLFSFVWINPWQFLDALGSVDEAPEWGCPQQLLESPVGFSSFHPQALPGKLGSSVSPWNLQTPGIQPPGPPKSKTGEEGWGYSQCGVMPVTGN